MSVWKSANQFLNVAGSHLFLTNQSELQRASSIMTARHLMKVVKPVSAGKEDAHPALKQQQNKQHLLPQHMLPQHLLPRHQLPQVSILLPNFFRYKSNIKK